MRLTMSRNFSIKPECEADTALIEVIGFRNPDHQRGIPEVIRSLEKQPNLIGVGLVDRDKKQPPKMNLFLDLRSFNELKLLNHCSNKRHFLITHPPLEYWLYEIEAKNTNIDPAKYGFSSRAYFQEFTKTKEARFDANLRNFFNALKQKSKTLQTLQAWLEELVN
jgi:hypothetical protein